MPHTLRLYSVFWLLGWFLLLWIFLPLIENVSVLVQWLHRHAHVYSHGFGLVFGKKDTNGSWSEQLLARTRFIFLKFSLSTDGLSRYGRWIGCTTTSDRTSWWIKDYCIGTGKRITLSLPSWLQLRLWLRLWGCCSPGPSCWDAYVVSVYVGPIVLVVVMSRTRTSLNNDWLTISSVFLISNNNGSHFTVSLRPARRQFLWLNLSQWTFQVILFFFLHAYSGLHLHIRLLHQQKQTFPSPVVCLFSCWNFYVIYLSGQPSVCVSLTCHWCTIVFRDPKRTYVHFDTDHC